MQKSKSFLLLILTIIFAFSFFITYYKVNLLMYDDAFYACILRPYENNFILNNFVINTAIEHYQLIAVFFSKFFGTILPDILGFHPQDFILQFGHFIKGFFYIVSILVMTFFVFAKKQKNIILFSSIFLFLFFVVLMITMQNARDTFSMYSAFFRFQMPLAYLFAFFTLSFLSYADKDFKYKKWLVFLYVLNILDGNEITIFLVQIFILAFILKIGLSICKSNKFLTILYILLPTIKMALSVFTNKYRGDLLNEFSLPMVCDYFVNYLKFIFCDNILFFALFFIVFVLFILKNKDKTIINFVSTIFVSSLLFLFLLIVYGKVSVVDGQADIYLLNHWHIKSFINVLLMLLSTFLFVRLIKDEKRLAIMFAVISFLLIFIVSYVNPQLHTFRKGGHLLYERDDMYKFEKEVLAQAHRYNGDVYLPYEPSKKMPTFSYDYDLFYYYFVSTYKINPDNLRFVYVTKEEVERRIKETDIYFSSDELKNVRFKNLYGNDFYKSLP